MLNRNSVLNKEYSLNYLGLFFWFLWRQTIFLINSRKERELQQRAVWWLVYGLHCEMSTALSADGTPVDVQDGGMPSGDALEGDPNSDRAGQGKGKGATRSRNWTSDETLERLPQSQDGRCDH
jgi:hypothetical protein